MFFLLTYFVNFFRRRLGKIKPAYGNLREYQGGQLNILDLSDHTERQKLTHRLPDHKGTAQRGQNNRNYPHGAQTAAFHFENGSEPVAPGTCGKLKRQRPRCLLHSLDRLHLQTNSIFLFDWFVNFDIYYDMASFVFY